MSDILGGPAINLWNHAARLFIDASGEAIAVGSYGPALADTESDAFAFAVDTNGRKRYGIVHDFPDTPQGSFDHGSAGAAGSQPLVLSSGFAFSGGCP